MPTPEEIAASSLFINEVYLKLEADMLTNIAKKLATGQMVTQDNVLDWQVAKLLQLGPLQQEQQKLIAEVAGVTPEVVRDWLTTIAQIGAREIETGLPEALPYATVPAVEASNMILNAVLLMERQTFDTLNLVNANMLASSNRIYTNILTEVTAEVLAGVSTHDQALRKAGAKWTEEGIPALVDKAGRKWSTEAYISMVTQATSKRTATAAQEARLDEYDIDLVEISSHRDSRPSHIEYQGRLFSRSGKSKRYTALSDTSYGAIDGIVTGIRCSHQLYPFVNGVSIKRYQPYPKKESIERYKQSQKQRAIEREIRKAKKEVQFMETLKDTEGVKLSKQKVRAKQAKMRQFISDSGRRRRNNREQIIK